MSRTGDDWQAGTLARLKAEQKQAAKQAHAAKQDYTRLKAAHGPNSAFAVNAYMSWRDYRQLAAERGKEAAAFREQHNL